MANTYLSKTLSGSPTDNNKWTWSAWVKRSKLTTEQPLFYADDGGTSYYTRIQWHDTDQISVRNRFAGADKGYAITTAMYRDTASWYHLQVVLDTNNATAGDRLIIYVNGERVTAFDNNPTITQNAGSTINDGYEHRIGRGNNTSGSSYFDGNMTHIHFVDGQAYAPTVFGETDSTSGIWKPKTAPSVTYGTNGFFLKMENSGAMGTDSSGNTNTFTVSGNLTQNVDTPSNNFATFNPLRPNGISQTYSNGNNTVIRTGTGGQMNGTLGVTKGKWYYECLIDDYWQYLGWTVLSQNTSQTATGASSGSGFYGLYSNATDALTYANGTGTAQGSYTAMASGQIWGIAFDADNAKMYFSVNGVWENSSDPANQTNPAMSNIPVTDFLVPAIGQGTGSRSSTIKMNFGQGFFGTTAVASANADANGHGAMEYAVPSGYYTLNTKNLKEFG